MISKYIDFKTKQEFDNLINPAKSIKEGKLVLFPTETVYGIGANALDEQAVQSIFIAKGREQDNPLIVHISDLKMLNKIVKKVGETEKILIKTFWPGPLTIIFTKKEIIPKTVTAGLDTVAIRMPSNKIARKLIEYSKVPIAAPSANVSGKPSGTIIDDIIDELDGKVEYIIDSGVVEIGIESTVVRVVDKKVHILRPGKISPEQIKEIGLEVIIEKQILDKYQSEEKVMSPGMKYKHYAPNTKCLLIYSEDNEKLIKKINETIKEKNNVVVLSKTKNLERYDTKNILNMGETLEEISKNIFTLLRKADLYKVDLIIIEGVTTKGLGLAIMNRLIRACSNNYIEC